MSERAEDDPLRRILDELEGEFTPETDDECHEGLLYHYTDAGGFHGILSNRTIWATDYRFLNDRSEMLFGEGTCLSVADALARDSSVPEPQRMLLRELVSRYSEFRPSQVLAPFVASFSTKEDMLSQWRAYSDDGAGYSIGFRSLRTRRSPDAPVALWLVRCQYGSRWLEAHLRDLLLRVCERYDEVSSNLGETPLWREPAARTVMASFIVVCLRYAYTLAARVKHPGFAEEDEYRLIAAPLPGREGGVVRYRKRANDLVPYIPLTFADEGQLLDVGRVYVGPGQDSAAVSAASGFLVSLGYAADLVVPSQVPYRGKR